MKHRKCPHSGSPGMAAGAFHTQNVALLPVE